MNLHDYLIDQRLPLFVCFSGALLISALLWLFGLGSGELVLLWLCFLCIVSGYFFCRYRCLHRRFLSLRSLQDSCDHKYLLAEIADAPYSATERFYFSLMRTALKSMTEEVSASRRQNREYREFVEQWVHEIKVPVTGIFLLCENNRSDLTRKLLSQAEQISQSVERALFYARLDSVEKDYLIREVSLRDCVLTTLADIRQFLIQSHTSVSTEALSGTVYSDEKWLRFILQQILTNSVKYCGDAPPAIDIASREESGCMTLSVTDQGIGIRKSEIRRVFDKGFVGSNGRAGTGAGATGIGLYLCRELCAKLGIGIELESEEGVFTTVRLHFPKGDFFNV